MKTEDWLEFDAKMEIIGVNPYVLVSIERAAAIKPARKGPIPVLVQVNGQPNPPWHINMVPKGDGTFYLYLHGDVRRASGTGVGDTVHVRVRFDDAYRNGPMHDMPKWFRGPLEADSAALANWQDLTPSRQKEILRYLVALKSDEARQRNVTRALKALGGDATRYMGRDWNAGQ